MESKKKIEIIESQLRHIYAQIVWSHKIQEKQADIYRKRQNRCEVMRIVTSSLTSSGIIASILVDSELVKIITAIISFITLFINSYLKSYDLATLASEHKNSALELLDLRNRLSSTLTDIKIDDLQLEDIKEIRDGYINEIEGVYKNCRDASNKAVEKARISLTKIQDNTFSDEEINSYLPVYTRKEETDESK